MSAAQITRTEGSASVHVAAQYAYNHSGIRARSLSTQTINGVATTNNRFFLVDEQNHTGYAQVMEESTTLGGTPVTSYTLGDDVISQASAAGVRHLLYDGHGSTRLLSNATGSVTDRYDYDAYGKTVGGDPNLSNPSATTMLYSGEQFDPELNNYYLRARYFDQNVGRFNSLDPFAGNNDDPQSLHKYAYTHCDPVNGIDPSGKFTLCELLVSIAIVAIAITIVACKFAKKRTYGAYMGPDITTWLYSGLKFVSTDCSANAGVFIIFKAGRWNTWDLPYRPNLPKKLVQSHVIAGMVVPDDVGGNIAYGFGGNILGYSLGTLQTVSTSLDRLQKWGFRGDESEDTAAIEFGYTLAEKYKLEECGGPSFLDKKLRCILSKETGGAYGWKETEP